VNNYRVVLRAYTGVIHCILPDSEPKNLPYHHRGPQTDKYLPPGPFTGQFLRKGDI
jgi:hypothetical protein